MDLTKSLEDCLLVSISFHPDSDTGVLIVGRKRPNDSIDIVNAFEGEEARELYQKLTEKRGE